MDQILKNSEALGKIKEDKDSLLQQKDKEMQHLYEQISKVMQEKADQL